MAKQELVKQPAGLWEHHPLPLLAQGPSFRVSREECSYHSQDLWQKGAAAPSTPSSPAQPHTPHALVLQARSCNVCTAAPLLLQMIFYLATGVKILNSQANDTSRIGL